MNPSQVLSPQFAALDGVDPEAVARLVDMILNEGYTLGHALRVSDRQMQAIYNWGYDLQRRGQFERGMRVFECLCTLDQYDEKSWIALGFCRERLNHLQEAIAAYMMAGMMAPENPIPPLRAAECLLRTRKLTLAESAAKTAIELTGDDPRLRQRRERAEFLLKVIRKQLEKRSKSDDN